LKAVVPLSAISRPSRAKLGHRHSPERTLQGPPAASVRRACKQGTAGSRSSGTFGGLERPLQAIEDVPPVGSDWPMVDRCCHRLGSQQLCELESDRDRQPGPPTPPHRRLLAVEDAPGRGYRPKAPWLNKTRTRATSLNSGDRAPKATRRICSSTVLSLSVCALVERNGKVGGAKMNPNSELFGWAILVATCLGPIAAVLVTR
jgi:hypothetical protein